MNSNDLMTEQQQLEMNQDDHMAEYQPDDQYDENMAHQHQDDNGHPDDMINADMHHHQHQEQQLYNEYDEPDHKLGGDEPSSPHHVEDDPLFQEPEGTVQDFVVNQDDEQQLGDNNTELGDQTPENSVLPTKEEPVDPNIWVLPPDKDICTLEEIRRGQVVNRVAPNECPVLGCGKKINENSLEPSPGTIASGLRTHVLFVHYANRKGVKKRKLGWSGKRRASASPKKPFGMPHPNMHSSTPIWDDQELDGKPDSFYPMSNDMLPPLSSGTSLIQRNYNNQNRNSPPGSLLNKKIKQLSSGPGSQQSSLQSLMQATGMGYPTSNSSNNNGSNINNNNNGHRFSPQNKLKGQDLSSSQKNFNQTTSSLFSILAGLTQQQQQQQQPQQQQHQQHQQSPQQPQQQHHTQQRNHLASQQQQQQMRNIKSAHSGNTISVSQCSKSINNNNNSGGNNISSNNNNNNNNGNFNMSNQPINSSLLSLLNDKISGNVASALHSQLRKSTPSNPRANHYNNQQNISNHDSSLYNNGASYHESPTATLNPFIESVARRSGSNIGPAGIIEVKKIIEKFTSWLICSSQTIADHYVAPFAGEATQQKPEISASDVILAYKMMQKSPPQ